jgi:hypothetical protein
MLNPFEDDDKDKIKEITHKLLRGKNIKERMRLIKEKKDQNFRDKKIFISDLKNFKKYFNYAGEWKQKTKFKELLLKREEQEVFEMLRLENNLNANRSYEVRRDLAKLGKIGYKRHEFLDRGTLTYSFKSNPNETTRFLKSVSFVWANTSPQCVPSTFASFVRNPETSTVGCVHVFRNKLGVCVWW